MSIEDTAKKILGLTRDNWIGIFGDPLSSTAYDVLENGVVDLREIITEWMAMREMVEVPRVVEFDGSAIIRTPKGFIASAPTETGYIANGEKTHFPTCLAAYAALKNAQEKNNDNENS